MICIYVYLLQLECLCHEYECVCLVMHTQNYISKEAENTQMFSLVLFAVLVNKIVLIELEIDIFSCEKWLISWYLYYMVTQKYVGAHVESNLCYLICVRHLIFFPKRPIFFMRG